MAKENGGVIGNSPVFRRFHATKNCGVQRVRNRCKRKRKPLNFGVLPHFQGEYHSPAQATENGTF